MEKMETLSTRTQSEGQDSVDSDFEKGVEYLIEQNLQVLRERFENREILEENLPFHDAQHTQNVINYTAKILRTIGASGRDVVLGKGIASGHDVVQDYILNERDDGRILRQRASGTNESASFDEFKALCEKINKDTKIEIFTPEDLRIAKEAFDATVPSFNPNLGTVFQANVVKETSDVARAVALADLGTAGIGGAEAFLKDGNSLFREENIDIARAITGREDINEVSKESYRERMLNWSKTQPAFAIGRQSLFEDEVAAFSSAQQKDLKGSVFKKFEESVKGAQEVAKKRSEMAFEKIAIDMGYELV